MWPPYENLLMKLHLFYDYCNYVLSPDELLLVECRQPPSKEQFAADSIRGPSAEEIRVVTENLEERNILKLHSLEFNADVSVAVVTCVCRFWHGDGFLTKNKVLLVLIE